MPELPTYDDVLAAARLINGQAVVTPLLTNALLNDRVNGRIFLKAECLQRTGSFKFRGAFNALSMIPKLDYENGVIACSSGNHAQGVAEAARLLDLSATILMPSDAPASKKRRTERSGAKVVEYDRYTQDRDELVNELVEQSGGTLVHPYENFHVIAGQGTVGLEIAAQMKDIGETPDEVLVCAGGGGLMAGTLIAVKKSFPEAVVRPVEPEFFDDQARSHAAGKRLSNSTSKTSICDAIVTPMPGELSFDICRNKIGAGLVVSDNEALDAVAFAYEELKLIVEPGGAVCLAAILAGKIDCKGKTVAITLSGGNMDADMLQRALASR